MAAERETIWGKKMWDIFSLKMGIQYGISSGILEKYDQNIGFQLEKTSGKWVNSPSENRYFSMNAGDEVIANHQTSPRKGRRHFLAPAKI